jgi:hypothetical protein
LTRSLFPPAMALANPRLVAASKLKAHGHPKMRKFKENQMRKVKNTTINLHRSASQTLRTSFRPMHGRLARIHLPIGDPMVVRNRMPEGARTFHHQPVSLATAVHRRVDLNSPRRIRTRSHDARMKPPHAPKSLPTPMNNPRRVFDRLGSQRQSPQKSQSK